MLKQFADCPAGVQALAAVGTVTADDYRQVFAPLVHQARASGRRLRLVYQFGPDFAGITPGAMWADARLGLEYAQLLDGCAVVSDIDWIATPARRIGKYMPCPVRVYPDNRRDDAMAWLTSLSQGAPVSAGVMAKAFLGGIGAGLGGLGEVIASHITGRR